MRSVRLTTVLLGGLTMGAASQGVPPLYRPPGMWTNDNWFCRDGDTFHAFYLQVPAALGDPGNWALREGWQHVGHATSTDLLHWTDHGPALVAVRHTWNDLGIATGSVAQKDGRWWMVFTAHGREPGIGLAVSDDLMAWTKVGDGPVVSFAQPFAAAWEGQPVQWRGCADPYLYPEPIEGWWIIVLNSQIVGAPPNTSGCLTTLRSRDLLTWEADRVLAYPRWFERLETPQLWERGGRWYLYFGGAHDHDIPEMWQAIAPEPRLREARRVNCVLVADAFAGPYRPVGDWCLDLPDGKWGYIHKVLPGPDGQDVLLSSVDLSISRPYPVTYAQDGSLVLHRPLIPSP